MSHHHKTNAKQTSWPHSSRSPKSGPKMAKQVSTMRRGTLRKQLSTQSNASTLTVSSKKVMAMPKAPTLRPKAKKEEAPKAKPNEVVTQQLLDCISLIKYQLQGANEPSLRPPNPQQPAGVRRLSLLPAMPTGLDDLGPVIIIIMMIVIKANCNIK